MCCRRDPSSVLKEFSDLSIKDDREILKEFLSQNFGKPGEETVEWHPKDWSPSPRFLSRIRDKTTQKWAADVHRLWFLLGRQIKPRVYESPERYSLLPLKHPYMIVAGGRFRECYYWDSFWILKGLLVSDMHGTARMIVENLLDLVKRYGFVPNGNRCYYLSRSQPPYLALMVDELITYYQNNSLNTAAEGLLDIAIPLLDREYGYWMEAGGHAVELADNSGKMHRLNRFFTDQTFPRPESFREDLQTSNLQTDSFSDSQEVCRNLAAAAESGWDFSSRWLQDPHSLKTIQTTDIIPADLNSLLYRIELTIAKLACIGCPEDPLVVKYTRNAVARKQAIHQFLWDAGSLQWRDYNFIEKCFSKVASISNFLPLWSACFDPVLYGVDANAIVRALKTSGLILPGGFATTLTNSGEQWDYPNAWPPLQHMMVEALAEQPDCPDAWALGEDVAKRWLHSNYQAFKAVGGTLWKA